MRKAASWLPRGLRSDPYRVRDDSKHRIASGRPKTLRFPKSDSAVALRIWPVDARRLELSSRPLALDQKYADRYGARPRKRPVLSRNVDRDICISWTTAAAQQPIPGVCRV